MEALCYKFWHVGQTHFKTTKFKESSSKDLMVAGEKCFYT